MPFSREILCSFFLVLLVKNNFVNGSLSKLVDARTMPQGKLVKFYGYPFENHTVVTSDGYHVTVGRIPFVKGRNNCTAQKSTVLITHGIWGNGDSFVYLGKNKSLGLILSDECFDVWLANNRGSRYSSKHMKYTTKNREFWNTTLDDLANETKDIVDYIINVTRVPQIHGVGFSMGSTLYMIYLSLNPEKQKYFKSLQFMAPVAYLDTFHAAAEWLPKTFLYTATTEVSDLLALPTQTDGYIYQRLGEDLCNSGQTPLCLAVSNFLNAPGEDVEGNSNLRVVSGNTAISLQRMYSKYFPERMAVKTALHLGQFMVNKNMAKYDYGTRNKEIYGTVKPPNYPIENIHIPIHLYHAKGDIAATPTDVARLMKELPNIKYRQFIDIENFAHSDFLISWMDTKALVYDNLIYQIKSYETGGH